MARDTALPSQDIGAMVSGSTLFLVAILLLGCGWSIAASGATNITVSCQDFGDTLQSLDAPALELSISLVDLPNSDAGLGLAKPLDAAGANSDATVPYLYLTSRVAAMLREVFDDDEYDRDAKQGNSAPPVAEGKTNRSSLPTLEESDLADPSDTMPRFQRPMYRTDI